MQASVVGSGSLRVCVYVLLKQRKSTTNDRLIFMAVGQITRGASGVSPSLSPSPKAKDQDSSSKTGRESELYLTSPCVLFRPPTDWVRPTHIRK